MNAARPFRKYRHLLCLLALLAFGSMRLPPLPSPPRRIHLVHLREQLKSPDVSRRLQAVRELGRAYHHEDIRPATEALGTVLDDPSPRVRLEALRMLDRVLRRNPVTEEDLSAGRADGDSKAEWLLARVLSAAQDKDHARRAAALRALGCFHVPQAWDLLRKAASEKDPAIRVSAIRVMERTGSEHFVGSLLKALEDPDHQVQKAAIHALLAPDRRTPKYRKALRPAIEPLMRMFETQEHPLWREAARALGSLRAEQAVPMLIRALEDPKVTGEAASALERIRTQTAIDALVAGLQSKHDSVRGACAAALIWMHPKYDGQVIGPLVATLKDRDPEVLARAARAFQYRTTTEGVPSLIGLLMHGRPKVRQAAAKALRHIGDKRPTGTLGQVLKNPTVSLLLLLQIAIVILCFRKKLKVAGVAFTVSLLATAISAFWFPFLVTPALAVAISSRVIPVIVAISYVLILVLLIKFKTSITTKDRSYEPA